MRCVELHLRVRLFAALADRAGVREFELQLSDGATAADGRDAVARRYPQIAALCTRSALAVNAAYVPAEQRLSDGDELALIPPVSGG